jgi:hypothetical protein
VIDDNFHDYVREMEDYFYYDKKQRIVGYAERAHVYNYDRVEIQMRRHKKVTVYLEDRVFNKLLRTLTRRRRPKLSFYGYPIRHVSDIGANFSEFEASSYKVLPK